MKLHFQRMAQYPYLLDALYIGIFVTHFYNTEWALEHLIVNKAINVIEDNLALSNDVFVG